MTNYIEIYADSARGIYIPQYFAETYVKSRWKYIDESDISVLRIGPDHEQYWDAWDNILDNAETTDGWTLYQDGDLFVVNGQSAVDDINEHCAAILEYETSHVDAGNNYAHMLAESWTDTDTSSLVAALSEQVYQDGKDIMTDPDYWSTISRADKLGIDPRWREIEPETLADIALESFEMESGHIFSNPSLSIAAYPVGEIETQLPDEIDGLILDLISDSCDAYIQGRLAYIVSDAVWFAVINVEKFNANIAAYFEGSEQ